MAQDVPRLARLAVETAIATLDGAQDADTELVVPPHLIVRGTTAQPGQRPPANLKGHRLPDPLSERPAGGGSADTTAVSGQART
jgi:hypothetical protein